MKNKSGNAITLSFIALITSVIVTGIIIAICGYDPIEAYAAIFKGAFGSKRGFAQTVAQATPLIFTGLAFTFAKKASLINLGVEGQMYFGALGACLVGLADLGLPAPVHLILAILGGMVCGALYAGIIGVMKVKFGSNEVVAGFMLNSISTLITAYLLNGPLLAEGSVVAQSEKIVEAAQMPRLVSKYQVTIAIFIAIAACIFITWLINNTNLGYEIRVVGYNRKAAETAGINVSKIVLLSICISGAIAGLAGVNQVLGVDRRFISDFSPGYGFSGIAVSALAAESPLASVFAGLLFGILKAGVMELNRTTGIPTEFVDVAQAMVVIFVSAPMFFTNIKSRIVKLSGSKKIAGAKGGAAQ